VLLKILDWHYKIRPITDHRAKFRADLQTHLGDFTSGKKTSCVKHKSFRKLSFSGGLTRALKFPCLGIIQRQNWNSEHRYLRCPKSAFVWWKIAAFWLHGANDDTIHTNSTVSDKYDLRLTRQMESECGNTFLISVLESNNKCSSDIRWFNNYEKTRYAISALEQIIHQKSKRGAFCSPSQELLQFSGTVGHKIDSSDYSVPQLREMNQKVSRKREKEKGNKQEEKGEGRKRDLNNYFPKETRSKITECNTIASVQCSVTLRILEMTKHCLTILIFIVIIRSGLAFTVESIDKQDVLKQLKYLSSVVIVTGQLTVEHL